MGATVAAMRSTAPLLEGLAAARARSDELFAIVRPEALYDRPIAQRHRIIFYVGHLEAFDWNLLGPFLELPAFAPALDKLFAFGIDPLAGGLPADQPRDWPTRDEVDNYTRKIRETLSGVLAEKSEWRPTGSGASAPGRAELALRLHVAIEHRLMHAETLAYMLHQLPVDRKQRPAQPDLALPAAGPRPSGPRLVEIPAGRATLGLRRAEGAFGWDNEFEEHSVEVPEFRIGAYPVTNREFLRFLEDGGYQHRELWNEADWKWLVASGTSHPAFWVRRDGEWLYRTMFGEVRFSEVASPADWPAAVSHAEASAYARWAELELPSESEWHRAAYGTPEGTERAYPWGEAPPDATRGNFDFARWNPTPVNAFPAGASAFGVADLAGNGWEWTRTPFAPFEGFEAFSFYPGYSADFFDGQHLVMKGGSARTAAAMLRRSFRNWFQPRYPFVYSAFRCVQH